METVGDSLASKHGTEVAEVIVGDPSNWPGVSPIQYEYLDHTADVQLHGWGENLSEAFEQTSVSMFNYMTELDSVSVNFTYDIQASGHDLKSLLFHFLDEWLFAFCAEPFFVAKTVKVLDFDRKTWTIKARGWGESFDLKKHPQGAEIKAITYSNMQIHENDKSAQVFVIVDI